MDDDLRELLAAWRGDHDPGEPRLEALLARLRGDDAFRHTFVEEIRLLGMLRAVQAAEPRWLRLEDAIGWTARPEGDVEALAQSVVRVGRRHRRLRRFARWAAGATALVLLAGAVTLILGRARAPQPGPEAAVAGTEVATVIKIEDVRWEPGEGATPAEGTVVTAGRLHFQAGRLTLVFFSGVSLTVEGPADVELRTGDRVYCHYGKLRARVPRGAEGFTVLTAGYEVVDLGTEFAVNLEPGGKSRVMVFDGDAAVSVLGKDGRSVGGAMLERHRSVEVDAGAGWIRDVPADPDEFVPLGEFVPPPLNLDPGYAEMVRAARPWGYWRFETLVGGVVPNEVTGRPGLAPLGGVLLDPAPGANRVARFRPDDHSQAFLMDGTWTPPRSAGYAIEVWVQADLPTPRSQGRSALVGLIDRQDGEEKHLSYLELTARGRRSPHEPCTVRFVDRWPTGRGGGADVFSRRTVVTTLWRHIVSQKNGDTLELYVDGELVGTTPARLNAAAPEDAATTACRLLVGRLKRRSLPPNEPDIRAFEGRLDELAVYGRPLTPEEIRRHADARQGP
ncbi:MAG TPA: LamG-like jellyroll fold domain-containing protein [Gemmataceae bacterium]|nr:LamG-like jellyroll fold domain-containing protein [Gemmataceae bacterium]